MSKKLIDILSPEDIAKSIAQNKKLLAIQSFKKGPRFIVDSKGRVKKIPFSDTSCVGAPVV